MLEPKGLDAKSSAVSTFMKSFMDTSRLSDSSEYIEAEIKFIKSDLKKYCVEIFLTTHFFYKTKTRVFLCLFFYKNVS